MNRAVLIIFSYVEPFRLISDSLEAVYSQIHDQIQDVILYSSSSRDTEKRIQATFANRNPPLRIVHRRAEGKRSAINECISIIGSRYEIAYFVDGDAIIAHNSLADIANYWKRYEDIGVCASTPILSGANSFIEKAFETLLNMINRKRTRQSEEGTLNAWCEAFYATRTCYLKPLPSGWINESDWFAKLARDEGFRVAIVPNAWCYIQPIRSLREFIIYRKRILAGHKKSSQVTKTRSTLSIREIAQYVLRHPRNLFYILFLIVIDFSARLLLSLGRRQPERWLPIISTKR